MDINDYMDAAKDKQGLTSDRQLSRLMGMSQGPINTMRNGKTLPKDETMITLALLGGQDVGIALLRLNTWRNGSSIAGEYYKNILSVFAKGAAMIGFIAIILTTPIERASAKNNTNYPVNHNCLDFIKAFLNQLIYQLMIKTVPK